MLKLGNMKGLLSITKILTLVLVLMFAGFFLMLMTNSPLSEAILQGMGLVDKETDYTVDINGEEQFSDLAMYVEHRASNDGCLTSDDTNKAPTVPMQNNGELGPSNENQFSLPYIISGKTAPLGQDEEGYPGLSDSYLSSTPECYGASGQNPLNALSGGIQDGAQSQLQEQGQDMEGIFSREKFEIKKQFTIGDQNSWIDDHFVIASSEGYEERVVEECERDSALGQIYDNIPGSADLVHVGTANNYVLFSQPDLSDSRVTQWYEEANDDPITVYCANRGSNKLPALQTEIQDWVLGSNDFLGGVPVLKNSNDQETFTFCPGDKGYVQVNKGENALNEGEAGEQWEGYAKTYPRIVITEKGEECGDQGPPLLKVYKKVGLDGKSQPIREGDVEGEGLSDWNDLQGEIIAQKRSVEVVQSGVVARLYSDEDFEGNSMTIAGVVEKTGFNDQASSLNVESGCKVRIFKDSLVGDNNIDLTDPDPQNYEYATCYPDGSCLNDGDGGNKQEYTDGANALNNIKFPPQNVGPGPGGGYQNPAQNFGNAVSAVVVMDDSGSVSNSCSATLYKKQGQDSSGKEITLTGVSRSLHLPNNGGNDIESIKILEGN